MTDKEALNFDDSGRKYSCFNCDSMGDGLYKQHDGPTSWFVGLTSDGQGQYACENCKDFLWNVHPMHELDRKP